VKAWDTLDAGPVGELDARARRDEAVALTLCGERSGARFTARPRGWARALRTLRARVRAPALRPLLESL
jgi:hypothetical protein